MKTTLTIIFLMIGLSAFSQSKGKPMMKSDSAIMKIDTIATVAKFPLSLKKRLETASKELIVAKEKADVAIERFNILKKAQDDLLDTIYELNGVARQDVLKLEEKPGELVIKHR